MMTEFAPGRVRKQNTYLGHQEKMFLLDLYHMEWWQLLCEALRHPA